MDEDLAWSKYSTHPQKKGKDKSRLSAIKSPYSQSVDVVLQRTF